MPLKKERDLLTCGPARAGDTPAAGANSRRAAAADTHSTSPPAACPGPPVYYSRHNLLVLHAPDSIAENLTSHTLDSSWFLIDQCLVSDAETGSFRNVSDQDSFEQTRGKYAPHARRAAAGTSPGARCTWGLLSALRSETQASSVTHVCMLQCDHVSCKQVSVLLHHVFAALHCKEYI